MSRETRIFDENLDIEDIEIIKQAEEEYQEYLERIKQEEELDEELEDSGLKTGISAIDMTSLWDKRVEPLADIFQRAISYIENHTDLNEDQIKYRINKCISTIEFKEEYPENPNGMGYVDNLFRVLSINENILKEKPQYIYEFIRHEMVHMVGRKNDKTIIKETFTNFWI